MLCVIPIIITILLYVLTDKLGWNKDIRTTGVAVCWITAILLFALDMLGEYIFGWWTTIINF